MIGICPRCASPATRHSRWSCLPGGWLACPRAVPPPAARAEPRAAQACAPASASASGIPPPPDNEVGSLNLRRSTDQGRSWGPIQTLYVGNIDFYVAMVRW